MTMTDVLERLSSRTAAKIAEKQTARRKAARTEIVETPAAPIEALAPIKQKGRARRSQKSIVPANGADEVVVIRPPNFQRAEIKIVGTAPFVQHAFSKKAQTMMEERQRAGSRGKKNTARAARNFEQDYEEAFRRSTEGWAGIPAPAFRNACISACKVVGFAMTRAKLSIFIEADGFDAVDGMPLCRLHGTPEVHQSYARNESGVADLRWRPMYREWHLFLRVKWDADQFSANDVMNLLARAGEQVGVGEGRPDSANSNGLGWGTFQIAQD